MGSVPKHIAVILDGNGRWAKKRGMPRNFGHLKGAERVEEMCHVMADKGVEYFTVYAFSTENWSRPADEVSALMKLLKDYLKKSIKMATENDLCVRVIGDKSGLSAELQESIRQLEEVSKDNKKLKFTIALNYGGRDEIVRAVKKLSDSGVAPGDINAALIEENLDTWPYPDPDLLIRTSGEQRISNFLLWQCAYSEFYFTDTAWPDFDEKELDKALEAYAARNRRFGGV